MTRWAWLWLAALWTLLCVVTVIWVAVDRRPPEWDHANHLEQALSCYRVLAEPGHDRFHEIMETSSFYPPLAICAAGLLYFLLPVVPLTAQTVMLLFLGIGLAAVYDLGRRLWDAETGLLAAFLLGTAPFVVFSLTNFQVDLPLAAMVALGLLALVRTEGFSRPGWSVGFGMVLGLGMLTKPTFALYLLPPLLWALGRALRAHEGRRLGLFALALLVGAVLALPWYGPRLVGLPAQITNRSFKQAAESGHPEAFSAAGLLFYPRVFQPQFGVLAGLLCGWGVWALRRERHARALLWAALVPFVIVSLIQNKNLRYTLPILPAAALAAAAGTRALPAGWRRAAVWACLALGLLQVPMAAFAIPKPPTVPPFLTALVFNYPPSGGDWRHERILSDLVRETRGRPATVAVVPNFNFLSVSTLRYETARRNLPFQMTRPWAPDAPPVGVSYVILKTGSQGPSFSVDKSERIVKAFASDPYLGAVFPVVAEYGLPDGSRAILRARRISPLQDTAPAEVAHQLETDPARFLAAWVREPAGLRVRVEYEPDAILAGQVRRLLVEADSALVGETGRKDRALLQVRDVRLRVEDLLFDPRRLVETGVLEVLDVGALGIDHLTVTEEDLRAFLAGQRDGAGIAVSLGEDAAQVRVTRLGPAISARVRVLPASAGSPFSLVAERVRVGRLRVPAFLVDWIVRGFDPTPRLRQLPIPVLIEEISVRPGRIQIGAPGTDHDTVERPG